MAKPIIGPRSVAWARFAALVVLMIASGSLAWAQQSDSRDALVSQVAGLNQAIFAAASDAAPPDRLNALLGQRAPLLSELVALDPAQALGMVLPQTLAQRLQAGSPNNGAIESQGEWDGRAEAIVYEITGIDATRVLDKKSGFALLQVK